MSATDLYLLTGQRKREPSALEVLWKANKFDDVMISSNKQREESTQEMLALQGLYQKMPAATKKKEGKKNRWSRREDEWMDTY